MLEDVLAALFQIARADGPLTKSEVSLPAAGAARLRARCPGLGAGAGRADAAALLGRGGGADRAGPLCDARRAARDASDDALRQAWRQLMRENHPDSLAARGVPQEFVKRATDKVAEINAAWDRVKRERKL